MSLAAPPPPASDAIPSSVLSIRSSLSDSHWQKPYFQQIILSASSTAAAEVMSRPHVWPRCDPLRHSPALAARMHPLLSDESVCKSIISCHGNTCNLHPSLFVTYETLSVELRLSPSVCPTFQCLVDPACREQLDSLSKVNTSTNTGRKHWFAALSVVSFVGSGGSRN